METRTEFCFHPRGSLRSHLRMTPVFVAFARASPNAPYDAASNRRRNALIEGPWLPVWAAAPVSPNAASATPARIARCASGRMIAAPLIRTSPKRHV
jgi:hypothetical protein